MPRCRSYRHCSCRSPDPMSRCRPSIPAPGPSYPVPDPSWGQTRCGRLPDQWRQVHRWRPARPPWGRRCLRKTNRNLLCLLHTQVLPAKRSHPQRHQSFSSQSPWPKGWGQSMKALPRATHRPWSPQNVACARGWPRSGGAVIGTAPIGALCGILRSCMLSRCVIHRCHRVSAGCLLTGSVDTGYDSRPL